MIQTRTDTKGPTMPMTTPDTMPTALIEDLFDNSEVAYDGETVMIDGRAWAVAMVGATHAWAYAPDDIVDATGEVARELATTPPTTSVAAWLADYAPEGDMTVIHTAACDRVSRGDSCMGGCVVIGA